MHNAIKYFRDHHTPIRREVKLNSKGNILLPKLNGKNKKWFLGPKRYKSFDYSAECHDDNFKEF